MKNPVSRDATHTSHAGMRIAWRAGRSRLAGAGTHHLADRGDRVTRDELFASLDGRSVQISRRTWRVDIYSIYDQQRSRWIQLRLDGQTEHTVTLRVAVDASVDDVIESVTDWVNREESGTLSIPRVAYIH